MKKKRYIKPVVSVMEMETTAILAGSVIRKASDEDYSDDKVQDFWDNNKGYLGRLAPDSLSSPQAAHLMLGAK